MSVKPSLNKVPGSLFLPADAKYTKEIIRDITKLSRTELEELLERQQKLLVNKVRLNRLPDKGKKIQNSYQKICEELTKRDEIALACELFSELNIASEGSKIVNSLEWNGNNSKVDDEVNIDSDDDLDTTNPLKIIAQHRDDEVRIKILKPEPQLITELDLNEIKSFQQKNEELSIISNDDSIQSRSSSQQSHVSDLDPHISYVCSKENTNPAKAKFKPYYTTKTDVHDPKKEKTRKLICDTEITSATPPPLLNSAAVVLSLHDSIELQLQQKEHMKIIHENQAVARLIEKEKRVQERLAQLKIVKTDRLQVTELFKTYRTLNEIRREDSSSDESDLINEDDIDSDQEVHDDCDERPGLGVSVVVYE